MVTPHGLGDVNVCVLVDGVTRRVYVAAWSHTFDAFAFEHAQFLQREGFTVWIDRYSAPATSLPIADRNLKGSLTRLPSAARRRSA